jgi:hypothetical protein
MMHASEVVSKHDLTVFDNHSHLPDYPSALKHPHLVLVYLRACLLGLGARDLNSPNRKGRSPDGMHTYNGELVIIWSLQCYFPGENHSALVWMS